MRHTRPLAVCLRLAITFSNVPVDASIIEMDLSGIKRVKSDIEKALK